MKPNQETEYDCRLAQMAAAWFQKAEALDVVLQYAFTGMTAPAGPERTLTAIDALVGLILQTSGAMEQEGRWINLFVDRQPERVRMVCASAGVCPVELGFLAEQEASTEIHQYADAYDLKVDWGTLEGGETPC